MNLWLAAGRRFAAMLAVFAAGTVALSLALGLAMGSSASRSVSIGFYLVGCFLVVIGFFMGNRGPLRLTGEVRARQGAADRVYEQSVGRPPAPFLGMKGLTWASPEQRSETINSSALFVVIGFVLIAFGVIADSRYPLF